MSSAATAESSLPKFLSKKNLIFLTIVVIVLIGASLSYYFVNQYKGSKDVEGVASAQQEIDATIKAIGKLINLPTNETPTIATVSDVSKLSGQAFFKNAKNGDKVLIYTETKKAYLYRPSTNKLIEVAGYNAPVSASVTPGDQQGSVSLTPTPVVEEAIQKVYKVAVYNGTLTAGLAASTQKNIEQKSKVFEVIAKGDASKSDYDQTIVADVSGAGKNAASKLVGIVGGKVSSLPSGEKSPSGVDFVIIIGSN